MKRKKPGRLFLNVMVCLGMALGWCLSGVGEMEAKAEEVQLVKGEKVQYMGYETHYYYVNGNLAYCLEPDMRSPGSGSYPSEELGSDELLAKAMYYVYGGPGFEAYMKPTLTGGWDQKDRSYCLSHCILSYIYDGCSQNSAGFIGLNEDLKKAVVQYTNAIGSWPAIPKTDISLSADSLKAFFDKEKGCQRTEVVTCTGDPSNSLIFSLPEGVALVDAGTGKEQTGRVEVYGQEQFYLAADVAWGNGTVWESGPIRGTLDKTWRTLVVKTGGGSQDMGSGHLVTVEPSTVSLNVKWIPQPEVFVDKYADKESKIYQVGDVITYTVDVTQQIQDAVAKNVILTDTILTEGVKLQKDSIVLLDAEHHVVSDAKISVTGNSYTIHAADFLQSVEAGEKYTVEYQVVIVDEELIGKEIENQVVVRSDNAPEAEDEEKVKVEKPKEPEKPQKPDEPQKPEEPQKPQEQQPQQEKAESIKTGDGANLIVLMLFVILSCTAIITCVKITSKTK